jgi:hypothetical protein
MLRGLRNYFLIRKSGYFDPRYYLLKYPDVRISDVDPLIHYLRHGWKEGRVPSKKWEDILTSGNFQIDGSAKINPMIAWIENERRERRASRTNIVKILILFYRFLFSFWLRKGIVFYGGYPYPEREKDGYYQRIRSIDSLFTDKWRIYIDSVRLPGKDFWYDIPEARVLVLRPHGKGVQRLFIEFWIRFCILQSRFIYFQSVLSSNGREFFWDNPNVCKIIDVHGAVPEEFSYQGEENNAALFNQVENQVVTHSNYIVVVSIAMRTHLLNKYPGQISGEFIILPNIPEIRIENHDKPYLNGKPAIIYAGGIQVWQQVPKIIDAMTKTGHLYRYKFYCPSPDEVKAMLPADLQRTHAIEIASKKRDEIFTEYRLSHYGFILREDRVVNNVSCPTKLVEYLAMGVIPIVDTAEIGDFKSFGMQYVDLIDLIQNNLPSAENRFKMAEHNHSVYSKILYQYKSGVIKLQRCIDHRDSQAT